MNKAGTAARHTFPGGLKFVRWDHTATPDSEELTVTKGDEVMIIKEDNEAGLYKVEHTVSRKIGNIPKRCFYPRWKVNFDFTGQKAGELSVYKDEIVGKINQDTENDMWLVMKENETEGKIPVSCFYAPYEAYGSHIAAKYGELSVNKGDNIGIINKDRDDGYWEGYFRGKTGLIPSKYFEPPKEVYWDYEAKQEGDLTVKKGDMVTIVDHEATSTHEKIRVRLDDKIGYISQRCFETPIQVYKDHKQRQGDEISVTKGEIVGMVKDKDPLEGYFRVRQGDTVGIVPKECFEIPARVILNYQSTNPNELSVKKGDEVSVMNAIANVQVRLGHKIGNIPLKCINFEGTEVAGMLEKKNHEENEVKKLP